MAIKDGCVSGKGGGVGGRVCGETGRKSNSKDFVAWSIFGGALWADVDCHMTNKKNNKKHLM